MFLLKRLLMSAMTVAAILPSLSLAHSKGEWEAHTKNVGYPQDELPVPITHCQDRQLSNFEDATIFHGAAVEPSLAVNPQNPNHIVAVWQQDRISDSGALECGIAFTFNGGKTWERTTIPFNFCQGGFIDRVSDVWLSFSKDGKRVYLSTLPFNITQNMNTLDQQGVAVNISDDGGKTWTQRQWLGTSEDAFNAPGSDLLPFDDKPSVTADPNHKKYAYVVRERFDSFDGPTFFRGPTFFTRTTNGGLTWSDFTNIYDTPTNLGIAPFVANSTFNNTIVVLPEHFHKKKLSGSLINFMSRAIVDTSNNNYFDIALIRSKDRGKTWDAKATPVIPIQSEPNGFPFVYTGGYTYDIGGNVTGGLGTLIRGDFNSTSPPQVVFGVNVNPKNGYIYLVFPTTQFRSDFLPQIGLTISRDGGKNWSKPIRINRTPQKAPNPQAFNPAVAITEDGYVAILYSDFRKDEKKNSDETLTDTWLDIYKEVDDRHGGSTRVGLDFEQELRLSKKSFIAQNGPVTTSGTMTTGDYPFLVANDNTFYACFTQSHKGPFKPPKKFFSDFGFKLFVDSNYRQSPYVSIIKRKISH